MTVDDVEALMNYFDRQDCLTYDVKEGLKDAIWCLEHGQSERARYRMIAVRSHLETMGRNDMVPFVERLI